MDGEPVSENEDFFNGKEKSKFSSRRSKIENAKKHGVAGALIQANKRTLSFWPKLAGFLKRPSFSLPSKKKVDKQDFIFAYLNKASFKKLFATQNIDFDNLLEEIKEDKETEAKGS